MAQTEDVELRDLVLETLEKNGSLAKIRALLRANVFRAFENECESKNHNSLLERTLKMPEGILALSLVHELLEFCNLKTTLFEYVTETHQGSNYEYIGSNKLADKLNIAQRDHEKEPILVSLLRKHYKISPRKIFDHGDGLSNGVHHQFKDDQNCTYIVHEDSSATSSSQSTSQSENSSDEKNRLQLRLPLDNSDTDTSSDSARDKTSSEYVPNDKIVIRDESEEDNKSNTSQQSSTGVDLNKYEEQLLDKNPGNKKNNTMTFAEYQQMQLGAHESSDSTSYVQQLKPYNQRDAKMLNTTGLPLPDAPFFTDVNSKISESFSHNVTENKHAQDSKSDPTSAGSLSNSTSIHSLNTDSKKNNDGKGTPEYSYDFSTSPNSKQKENKANLSYTSVADTLGKNMLMIDSPRQDSHSARSSISISDVADLIELSESNSPRVNIEKQKKAETKSTKRKNETDIKLPSDDSGDSSGSPIPSLSNLSLDLHSD